MSKLVLAGAIVLAHYFYDPWCCDNEDCRPIAAEEVQTKADGYHVLGRVVPYAEARVSGDADYHVCIYKGELRCFYAPPGGV